MMQLHVILSLKIIKIIQNEQQFIFRQMTSIQTQKIITYIKFAMVSYVKENILMKC